MATVSYLSVWIAFSLLNGAYCSTDIEIVYEKYDILKTGVQLLSDKLDAVENQMSVDKGIIINKQDEKIHSLKMELKTDIRQHVTAALTEILRGESFEDIIKSEVVSEMRHLKRTNHQMRRQLHQMMTSLGQVREDNRVYGEALLKGERENAELMSFSKCHVQSEILTVQLTERDRLISELKRKLNEQNGSCTAANRTNNNESDSEHDSQLSQLNRTLNSSTKLPSTTPTTTTEPTTVPTQLTTPEPQEERSRILVVPLWSSSFHQFRQVNIHSNSLGIYSHLNLKWVDPVVYISKLNTILIGLHNPDKIISSKLYTSRVVTVRHKVRTFGMAADEKLGIIFLTTRHPSYTISRMSLQGRHYTAVVSLVGYGDYPRGIAVHPDTQMIYSCNAGKLFSVRYDGSRLTTLDTGSSMYAVTLDISNSLLYFIKHKKLMKMSLSTNTTSEVTEFSFYIWNLLFYRDTVYYISYSPPYGTLGAVDVGQNSVSYTLQTVKASGTSVFTICLIP